MLNAEYHRKQAELFASLALANTSNVHLMEQYTALAKEHLAKAAEVDKRTEADPTGQMLPPGAASGEDGSN